MPRVAFALLLTLVVLPSSAGVAGHDVSAVRYAPPGLYSAGSTKIGVNGSRFLTVWALDQYPKPNRAYASVSVTAKGASSMPFLLPGVSGSPVEVLPWGSGFISLWVDRDHFDIVTLFASGGVQRVSHVPLVDGLLRFATNGQNLLVVDVRQVIQFHESSNVTSASVYDPDGRLLARTQLPADSVINIDVARAGDSFVVVTGGASGDVHFYRLDDAATIIAERELQGVPALYAMHAPLVAVAGDAAHAVVAWTPTESSASYVAAVSSSNDVSLQPLPRQYDRNPPIRVVQTASGYLILGTENGHVSVVRTNVEGGVIDRDAIPIANQFQLNDAAAEGDQFAAIVSPDRYPSTAAPLSLVIGTVLSQGVSTSTSPLVTSTASRQEQPVIVSDGVDYVSAWVEHDGAEVIAKVGRVSRTGVPLDGPGVTLPAPTKKVLNISIARGSGGDALVVVSAAEGTWAFRWSGTAGLADTAPIVLDSGTSYGTAVAWNGVSYLAVWGDGYNPSLAGRFVGSDGTAGAKFSIPMTLNSHEGVFAQNPAIAWDGQQFLVSIPTAYNDPCVATCPAPQAREIRLVRLSAAGSLLDTTPYRILNTRYARIATSGREFLLLASDLYYYNNITSAVVVHGETSGLSVSASTIPISGATASDVTWDGTYYDVAWTGADSWLRLWRLDRSGNVQQKLFTTLATPGGPSAAANDGGEVAIAVAEDAPPSSLSRARIYFEPELQPVAPVAAPTNAVSRLNGSNALLHWDGDASGFLVERLIAPNLWNLWYQLTGDVHEITVAAYPGYVFRIRGYGPDGSSSDGAIITIHSEPRTRTVRR